jgi:type IV secretory pathway VirB10-like protein
VSEQQQQQPGPQQSQPQPGYPPPYGWYVQAAAQQQRPLDRLTWKQKLILAGVLGLILLSFGVWNSCHSQTQQLQTKATAQQQPQMLAPNPQTIESQREAAERELAQAQANAEAAKQRLESGPMTEGDAQSARAGMSGQQDPDAQFWHQIRQEKWKREQDAPYASGVGFVTRPPREQQQSPNAETRAESSQPPASYYAPYGSSLPPQEAPYLQPASTKPQTANPPVQSATCQPNAQTPERYGFDQAEGPMHRIEEGTILPATLLNQLDGESIGPVICQISENVYDASGLNLLIPEGSKVLGEARAVNSNNQRRLAVSFHRISMPDGYALSLDKVPGLDQTGASALAGKVNNHYLQTFGMAMAVGAIAGLAQVGDNGATYSSWYGFREGVSQQTALSSEQILNRYLNRYPTITIKPGSRVKVVLLADLPDVPEYAHHTMPVNR